MADQDKYSKKINIPKTYDSDEDEGESGQGSRIGFADFMSGEQYLRDDQLPPDILKSKLAEHDGTHEALVKEQKEKIKLREKVHRGEAPVSDWRQEGKSEIDYWPHPDLSNSAQFGNGMVDKENNPVPDLQVSDANKKDRKEQELKYAKQYKPELAPKLAPKYDSTPRLIRR